MYSLAVEKRGLIAYDEKRVLLGDLANGQPNPNNHAYGHYSLVNKIQVEKAEEPAAAGNDLYIVTHKQRHKARLARAHALAIKLARRRNPDDSSDVDEAVIQGEDLVIAERAAEAPPNTSVRINDVIKQICASQNLPRPTLLPPIMPSARAGKL